MKLLPIIVKAKLWLWQGKGAWHFITIEQNEADLIKEMYMWPRKGFGSIPVKVTIGKTIWKTSVFPNKETFILPIKKLVRDAENINVDDLLKVTLEVQN
jgi:hypothetical protein